MDIAIVGAARTPFTAFMGPLATVSAPRLGAHAIQSALNRCRIQASTVSDVFMGNVLQAGVGQAPARQAALAAGLSASTRCVTINKVCGSATKALEDGCLSLQAGRSKTVVCGGMENMSAAPFLLNARAGFRLGNQQAIDGLIRDGLWDPHYDRHMGSLAERCAEKYALTREQQDAYAAESYRRAIEAQRSGTFAAEIVPVESIEKGKKLEVREDDGPGRVAYEKIPMLRPAFEKDGTITAANASSISDGAAAVVLMRRSDAVDALIPIWATITAIGSVSQEPELYTTAPVAAARLALEQANWAVEDVDVWEVNEAFSVVPLAFANELRIGLDQLNVNGGAIALGHPIGASGARIIISLLSILKRRNQRKGVAAICIGGGEGMAVCIESPL